MNITYGKGFDMPSKVLALQAELLKFPQYQPETKHYFHAGMYCREVFRHAGVIIVGKVHKKEHFYVVASGTVLITTDDGVKEVTGPAVLMSKAGTKRAVTSLTDAVCMTFHQCESTNVEDAETELVEPEPNSMYTVGNMVKQEVLQ